MLTWTVEKSNSQDVRGPMRGRPPEVETVIGDDLVIEGGALVFRTGGIVTAAKGPGSWSSVTMQPTQPLPDPGVFVQDGV